MRTTEYTPSVGQQHAQAFVKTNPTLGAIVAEIDRLSGLQRDQGAGQAWLLTRDGADYRMTLGSERTRLEALQRRAGIATKRQADADAQMAQQVARAALTVDDRLERLERAAKRRGWSL